MDRNPRLVSKLARLAVVATVSVAAMRIEWTFGADGRRTSFDAVQSITPKEARPTKPEHGTISSAERARIQADIERKYVDGMRAANLGNSARAVDLLTEALVVGVESGVLRGDMDFALLYHLAVLEIERGRTSDATHWLSFAAEVAESRYGELSKETADIVALKARVHLRRREFASARQAAESALDIYQRLGLETGNGAIVPLRCLTAVAAVERRWDDACRYQGQVADRVFGYARHSLPWYEEIAGLGYYHLQNGDYDVASSYLTSAVSVLQSVYGDRDPRTKAMSAHLQQAKEGCRRELERRHRADAAVEPRNNADRHVE